MSKRSADNEIARQATIPRVSREAFANARVALSGMPQEDRALERFLSTGPYNSNRELHGIAQAQARGHFDVSLRNSRLALRDMDDVLANIPTNTIVTPPLRLVIPADPIVIPDSPIFIPDSPIDLCSDDGGHEECKADPAPVGPYKFGPQNGEPGFQGARPNLKMKSLTCNLTGRRKNICGCPKCPKVNPLSGLDPRILPYYKLNMQRYGKPFIPNNVCRLTFQYSNTCPCRICIRRRDAHVNLQSHHMCMTHQKVYGISCDPIACGCIERRMRYFSPQLLTNEKLHKFCQSIYADV